VGATRGLRLLRVNANDWRRWRDLRLAALEEAPYAFSSRLSNWTGANDLESRWRARLSHVPFNVVAFFDESPAGIVSGAIPNPGEAQLISMWVAPSQRGKGLGDALIGAVVAWARENGSTTLHLDVFDDNDAALRLYARNGLGAALPEGPIQVRAAPCS